jgi:anthraniloyl-CoA monooxygenase
MTASYSAIIGHFAYWDDIEIHFRGTTHRIGGNGTRLRAQRC